MDSPYPYMNQGHAFVSLFCFPSLAAVSLYSNLSSASPSSLESGWRAAALLLQLRLAVLDRHRGLLPVVRVGVRVVDYTPFIRSSKHRAIIEQTFSKCIQNTRARRVL